MSKPFTAENHRLGECSKELHGGDDGPKTHEEELLGTAKAKKIMGSLWAT